MDRLLSAKHEAPLRRPPHPDVAFQQFVDAHRHLLVDWMARRMTVELVGPDAGQVDPGDVLSRAMERLWLRFEHLPQDPGLRKAWVERAIRLAALDAIRFQFGRHRVKSSARRPPTPSSRETVAFVRAFSVDFAATPSLREREGLAAEAGQAVQRLAAGTRNRYDDVLTRAAVVGAMATLTSPEQRVLRLTLEGHEPHEIVRATGWRSEDVREHLTNARWLVRRYVDHADADRLPARHRRDLHLYLDGKLRGRARTRESRHLRACAACQRAADLYRLSDRQLAVVLVLPGLIERGAHLPGGVTGVAASSQGATSGSGANGSLGMGMKGGGGLGSKLAGIVPGGKIAVLSSAAIIGTGSAVAGALAASQPRLPRVAAAGLRSSSFQTPAAAPLSAAHASGGPAGKVGRRARPQRHLTHRQAPQQTLRRHALSASASVVARAQRASASSGSSTHQVVSAAPASSVASSGGGLSGGGTSSAGSGAPGGGLTLGGH
ncbi:MAG: hypothetical protein ACR2HD_00740 [Solirubrobacteraceae bacterium]|nr:MAG: hypothetical protein DLM63_02475 [Solirubrobacterales bacterium]